MHVDWRESGVAMPRDIVTPVGTGQGRDLIERALPSPVERKCQLTRSVPRACTAPSPCPFRCRRQWEAAVRDPDLRERRILVVEDEYLVADLIAFPNCRRLGAIVLGPVGSLGEALDLIGIGAAIDAAVLDINLRGEMVYPAADLLVRRAVPLVFTSGYDPASIPPRFAGAGLCEKIDVTRHPARGGCPRDRRAWSALTPRRTAGPESAGRRALS